ncbi:Polyadenylate-binding protein/Hyperplastic disc protein [Pseudocohnilembus persalinus]|uniref:Polyadenylate-binding protein/Hyperplastic disc protein n=1 Tax=Pseudocohnilembus persalinus TaxID=266149 RepID=A0A0V0Q794_PSEPJ|nr:Polyadenylate-binding protein/Hyperplastic disc protein [Pseudocohnilembus persalinus]|eukprot:KRW98120.1 Polyadenylate-binding protein/Hyperplastic disc protein [Pseudocohnilembus persalinus]
MKTENTQSIYMIIEESKIKLKQALDIQNQQLIALAEVEQLQDRNEQLERNMYCQQQFHENEVNDLREIIQQQNQQADNNFQNKFTMSQDNGLNNNNYQYYQNHPQQQYFPQQRQHQWQPQSRNQNYNNRIQYLDKNGGINNDIQAQQQKNNKVLPENQSNKFETLKQIKENQDTFNKLDKSKQFQYLGLLMFPKVEAELKKYKKTADPAGMAQKITSMMVDVSVFEVYEIIETLEFQADFQERLQEAIELINENHDKKIIL